MQRQKNDGDGYGNDKKSDEQVWKDRRTLALVVFLALLSTFCLVQIGLLIGTESSNIGEMGDWIAGSTSIVLQSIVIYYIYQTYHNQKKELQDQRSMLKTANDEARRKRFEDVFYDLLTRYERIVLALNSYDAVDRRGRHVFVSLSEQLASEAGRSDSIERIERVIQDRQLIIGDWIRIVSLISKIIRDSNLEDDEKYGYLKIFRGLMSVEEWRVLAFHLVTRPKGVSETSKFLLQYNFFKYAKMSSLPYFEWLNALLIERHGYGVPTEERNND